MKVLFALVAALVLSSCSNLPTIVQDCATVVNDEGIIVNGILAATNSAAASGLITQAQAQATLIAADKVNAGVAAADLLCQAGSSSAAKSQVSAVDPTAKALKAALATAKPGPALDKVTAAAPK